MMPIVGEAIEVAMVHVPKGGTFADAQLTWDPARVTSTNDLGFTWESASSSGYILAISTDEWRRPCATE